jgi:photosystem II stability/assembly factor-like uncharacterized protein
MFKYSLLIFCFLSSQLDSNAQWKKVYTGYNDDLHDIHCIGNWVFACGQNSRVLASKDTGKSWSKLNVSFPNNLRAIYFFDSLTGIVTGENARVQKTYNGGVTWSQKYARTAAYAYDIQFQGNNGLLVGKDLLIASSKDAGETWKVDTTLVIKQNLNAVAISPGGQCWAVGDSSYILHKTLNQGKWNTMKYPGGINLTNVSVFTDSIIIISGGMPDSNQLGVHYNILLYSSDTGKTWKSATVKEMKTIYAASFLDKDTGLIVGSNGIVSKVYRPLTKRSQQLSGVASTLNDVFINEHFALIVGDGGTMLRSTNRGGFGLELFRPDKMTNHQIYPNPNKGAFKISNAEKIEKVVLIDQLGKSYAIQSQNDQYTVPIDLTGQFQIVVYHQDLSIWVSKLLILP